MRIFFQVSFQFGFLRACCLAPLILALAGCDRAAPVATLPPVQQRHELVVAVRNDSTSFFLDANDRPAGLEYDLISLFAEEMGVQPRFIRVDRASQALEALRAGRVHMAAAGVTTRSISPDEFVAGPVYQSMLPVVVYGDHVDPIRKPQDLAKKRIEVIAGSGADVALGDLQQQLGDLTWRAAEERSPEEMVEAVAQGTLDITVADSQLVSYLRRFYPALHLGPTLGPAQGVAWVFPTGDDPMLVQQAQKFFQRIGQNGTLKRLVDRYYGYLQRVQPADVEGFLDKRLSLLPRYRHHFHDAEQVTGIDWRLLAALGYQESHWDPFAVSPAGVRGLMMLTEDTADRMGVGDRSDPRQNILAGGRYLRLLLESMPAQIGDPDRLWMALAAYNVGLGHLEDARVLAERLKLDPNSWTDIKTTLLMLRNPAYFGTLKHGYARGGETVIFVETIRTYFDILARLETPKPGLFPASSTPLANAPPAPIAPPVPAPPPEKAKPA